MALDQEYFDSIHIDVVKKKYYNANKVEAVLEDIRAKAIALTQENEILRSQLNEIGGKKEKIGDAILSATAISQELISKAEEDAKAILADAEEKRAAIIEETVQQQEYAVQKVEGCYSRMKQQHMACIEAINAEWQEFLCGLFPDIEMPAVCGDEPAEPVSETPEEPEADDEVEHAEPETQSEEDIPAEEESAEDAPAEDFESAKDDPVEIPEDLGLKLEAIAQELFDMELPE